MAVLLGFAAIALVAGIGDRQHLPMLARLDDAIAGLIARSPGARAGGAIGKAPRADHDRADATPGPAIERALGKIFLPLETTPSLLGEPLVIAPGDTLSAVPLGGNSPTGGAGSPGGRSPDGVSFPSELPGGGDNPSPSGPPGSPSSPQSPSSPSPPGQQSPAQSPPVTAVPEPGTWLLTCAGIGLIGSMLRRHQAMRRCARR